jgi:hypothetical protein
MIVGVNVWSRAGPTKIALRAYAFARNAGALT